MSMHLLFQLEESHSKWFSRKQTMRKHLGEGPGAQDAACRVSPVENPNPGSAQKPSFLWASSRAGRGHPGLLLPGYLHPWEMSKSSRACLVPEGSVTHGSCRGPVLRKGGHSTLRAQGTKQAVGQSLLDTGVRPPWTSCWCRRLGGAELPAASPGDGGEQLWYPVSLLAAVVPPSPVPRARLRGLFSLWLRSRGSCRRAAARRASAGLV